MQLRINVVREAFAAQDAGQDALAVEVLKVLEATAPNADKVTQLDFGNFEKFAAAPVPSELVDKLTAVDVETLTPLEALNFLYKLKQTLVK